MMVYGCRKVKVFNNVTEAEIDRSGAFGFIEVENTTSEVIIFTVNDFTDQGHVGTSIPIQPGTTRQIPLATYKFTASGPVNVVAYGL